jgi:hypothetical protein
MFFPFMYPNLAPIYNIMSNITIILTILGSYGKFLSGVLKSRKLIWWVIRKVLNSVL